MPTDAEAIDLLRKTQASHAESNLQLHKCASSSPDMLGGFVPEDCSSYQGHRTQQRTQQSLGDTFIFSVSTEMKPFAGCRVLSTVNSVFDPLGLLARVTVQGRALLRELKTEQSEWDIPLPENKLSKWEP